MTTVSIPGYAKQFFIANSQKSREVIIEEIMSNSFGSVCAILDIDLKQWEAIEILMKDMGFDPTGIFEDQPYYTLEDYVRYIKDKSFFTIDKIGGVTTNSVNKLNQYIISFCL